MNTFYFKHISLAIIHITVLKIKYNSMLFIITTTLLTLPLCCLRFCLVILSVHAQYILQLLWRWSGNARQVCGLVALVALMHCYWSLWIAMYDNNSFFINYPYSIIASHKNISLYKLIHMTYFHEKYFVVQRYPQNILTSNYFQTMAHLNISLVWIKDDLDYKLAFP